MSLLNESRVVLKTEWISILNSMYARKREYGYVDIVKETDKFTLFDSDPKFNGVKALRISANEVLEIISEYDSFLKK
jgi:hypothetical protein